MIRDDITCPKCDRITVSVEPEAEDWVQITCQSDECGAVTSKYLRAAQITLV